VFKKQQLYSCQRAKRKLIKRFF